MDLATAIVRDDAVLLKDALARGANPNAKVGSVTALHLATMLGSDEHVSLLIENGANPNAPDANGRRPVHYIGASENGVRVLEALIAGGADINAVDTMGYTALDIAAGAELESLTEALAKVGGCRSVRRTRSMIRRHPGDSSPEI